MSPRFFAIAFALVLVGSVPAALAAPPPSPSSLPPSTDRYVFAELSVEQPNLTKLVITGDLYVYRYMVRGVRYDADQIGAASRATGTNAQGGPAGDAFVAEMEGAIAAGLTKILAASFPGAGVQNASAVTDRATLAASGGSSLDPPVRLAVAATVQRSSEAVGLGDLTDLGVNAAFQAGARIGVDFALTADPGHHIVYAIAPPGTPAGLRFATGPDVSADGKTLTIDVNNQGGSTPSKTANATLFLGTVTPPTAEDIRSRIDIQMGDIEKGASDIPVAIRVEADVRAVDISQRFPGALPVKVSLPFVNADGLRGLRQTGVLKDADLANANKGLLDEVRRDIEKTFRDSGTVTGGLSTSDLARATGAPYSTEPPVQFIADAKAAHTVEGASADDIDLALRIGAAADVELTLTPANGRATTYAIHPPSIGMFTAAEGGTVSKDGETVTYSVPGGAAQLPAKLSLRGKDAPVFDKEQAEIDVTVDLEDLDISLGKAMGGDLGNLIVSVNVKGNLNVIKIPDELKDSLPDKLQLEYLSADAIRLLIDRGYVSDANMTKLEESLRKQVAEKLGAALGGAIPVEGGFDAASLAASLVKTPVSADTPVVFTAKARLLKPVSGGPVEPQAAIALMTKELPLTLPKIQALDTVYTVILPKGLAVQDVKGTGGEWETGKVGKRDSFTVRPTGESAEMSVTMAVTPGFVMAKFWPIVLLAILILVLIVGTPIALVMRKRAKAGKK